MSPRFLNNALRFKFEILVVIVLPLLLVGLQTLVHQDSLMSALGPWLGMDKGGTDSWMPLTRALEQASAGKEIYNSLFFEDGIKFQYPPTSILIFGLLHKLGLADTTTLNQLNWWLVLGSALLAGLLGMALARDADNEALRRNRPLVGLICLFTCLLSYPIMHAYSLGQAQVWINFLFLLACLCWHYDKRWVAGMAIGMICLIKPQFGLFLLWSVLARQWKFIAGWAAVVMVGLALSTISFGIREHIGYVQVLSALSKSGESFFANQSLNGILNRLYETGPILKWQAHSFPPLHPVVRWGTLAFSALVIGAVLLRQLGRRAELLDFQLAALAFTMASPIAWEHHYGILPAIFIGAYFKLKSVKNGKAMSYDGALLALSFLLCVVNLGTWSRINPTPWNLLYSYLFFGAALLFLIIVRLYRSPAASRAPATASENLPA